MLQIIKREDNSGYEDRLRALGLASEKDISVSEVVNDGRADGYGIYRLTKDEIRIYEISYGEDLALADGILRSILFLAALKGVEKAVFENESLEPAKKLGISKSEILEPISDIFTGCEGCKSNA